MRIALCQMTASTDPKQNLAAVQDHVRRAAREGAHLVALPEAAMVRFGEPLAEVAEPLDGPWAEGVRAVARETGVTVVAGMFTPAGDGRVANTLLATGPGVEESYDKIHLYDAFGFRESDTVAPGDRVVTIDVEGVRVGLATCYDLRFPELFRAHADAGATVSVLPASWGAGPGKRAQWDLLVRARALDATVWVAAVDQSAPDPSVDPDAPAKLPHGVGHSALIGPDGTVRGQLGAAPDLLVGEVDAEEALRVRRAVAVLDNRQL
ncbi:carbon-nitrogen hydrolase family protein [Streptomyces kronopolitis]|uniref:carbon-nitrogen hydrolase family protein n=1 Tax=Streptomyces kronopolitis TaxID=1612435 RepID=UPI0020BE463F|nr:carbon-nitrogen hydrolase family protein [Streptomyces kronopolitis]MCL6298147.1 carbon-nitrogen hydrolase family protein [Streptomyces kronopolitis]